MEVVAWPTIAAAIEALFAELSRRFTGEIEMKGFRLARKLLKEMVGTSGLEPLTSSVSRKRSNQLSYAPTRNLIVAALPVRGKRGCVMAVSRYDSTPAAFAAE